MIWDQPENFRAPFAANLKEKVEKHSGDDRDNITRKRALLASQLLDRYGYAADLAHKELDVFIETWKA